MENLSHIAIIMDGNGRWAKAKGMPRVLGHAQGAKRVEPIVRATKDLGAGYLTLYTFSTENWRRKENEIEAIMKLIYDYLGTCFRLSDENETRIRVIGDRTPLSQKLKARIEEIEEYSSKYEDFTLILAINYGGRDEIVRAIRDIVDEDPKASEITEEYFSKHLDTGDIPDPDLLIRTGGEERISNFLLWQLCYTEFVFTDKYWPDFTVDELTRLVDIYKDRQRRYGKE